ncbi:YihY/virulence factor BrkB family protein [Cohnella boryungensis]|uniref:YihY/virulence factor BrkB family protein n=1 Tax=Cohnella boryungensis TaxID=768479 RepID=A0ABV8SEW4_9BACL
MTILRRLWQFIRALIARVQEEDVPSLGAQMTYYLILAFFPFLIFLVSLVGYANLSTESVMTELMRAMPSGTGEFVRDIVTEVTSKRNGTLLSVGMLTTVWAASTGVNAMIKALNKAYQAKETRKFWLVRIYSIIATLALGGVIVIILLTLVFGQWVGEYLFRTMGHPEVFPRVWSLLQVAIPLIVLFGVFLLVYRLLPNRKLSWKDVVAGSLFTTIGWFIISSLFSLYVSQFGNYEKTYGSLGAMVVLLIWLYWSSIALLIGGEINATLTLRRQEQSEAGLNKGDKESHGLKKNPYPKGVEKQL